MRRSRKFMLFSAITLLPVASGWIFREQLAKCWDDAVRRFCQVTDSHIKMVIVTGASPKVEKLIRAHLGTKVGANIFSFSTTNISNNLKKIGWIKELSVHTILPNILEIKVEQREPFAIYHHNKHYTLIDRDGNFIEDVLKNPGLPILSGSEANLRGEGILALLAQYPTIAPEVHSLALVQKRRWNLTLKNRIKILLPEQNLEKAIHILSKLLMQPNIQSSVISIDLRLPENIVISGLKKKQSKTAIR